MRSAPEHVCKATHLIKANKNKFKACSRAANTFPVNRRCVKVTGEIPTTGDKKYAPPVNQRPHIFLLLQSQNEPQVGILFLVKNNEYT